MAGIPSSGTIQLSQIINSFGMVINTTTGPYPNNLTSYYKGAGSNNRVQASGDIVYPVASSGNINIRSFVGTASEWTITPNNTRWVGYNTYAGSPGAGGSTFGTISSSPTYSFHGGAATATIAGLFDTHASPGAGGGYLSTTLVLNGTANLSSYKFYVLFEFNSQNAYWAAAKAPLDVGPAPNYNDYSPTITYSSPYTMYQWSAHPNGPFFYNSSVAQSGWLS